MDHIQGGGSFTLEFNGICGSQHINRMRTLQSAYQFDTDMELAISIMIKCGLGRHIIYYVDLAFKSQLIPLFCCSRHIKYLHWHYVANSLLISCGQPKTA